MRIYNSKTPYYLKSKSYDFCLSQGSIFELAQTQLVNNYVEFSITYESNVFRISQDIFEKLLKNSKPYSIPIETLEEDNYPVLVEQLQKKIVNLAKNMTWKFDVNTVKWLRQASIIEKTWRNKDEIKGVEKLLVWIDSRPPVNCVKVGVNKKAASMGLRVLKSSVPSIQTCTNLEHH